MANRGNKSKKLVLYRLKEETGIGWEIFQQNIDEMYPIGQPEDSQQRRIVKLTRNSFKETVFMKHKQGKKNMH